jgi:hypothetical protein
LTCASLGHDPDDLLFSISSGFGATLAAMGYDDASMAGRAASCWRAMSFVASGRAGELASLKAHAHKKSGKPWRDTEGRTLYRGALFMGPNAHRLFWWSGEHPEFVGVAGHDDAPPL